ncbi:MAG: hypothetical protein HKN33_19265 [Pyrinomonadaceae bacterium]|nr:hypothetical protein [Pyrinomonadaceae bacterium]
MKETRTARGIGVRELASLVEGECSASYISYLERNVYEGKDGSPTRPSESIVETLALGLEVSENEAREAAGYAPLSSTTSTVELLDAFPLLFDGYGRLSNKGKLLARERVEAFISELLDAEGIEFSDVSIDSGDSKQPIGPGLNPEEFTIDLSQPSLQNVEDSTEEFSFVTDEELDSPEFRGGIEKPKKSRN